MIGYRNVNVMVFLINVYMCISIWFVICIWFVINMTTDNYLDDIAAKHGTPYPPRSTVLFAILNRLSTGQITQYCL